MTTPWDLPVVSLEGLSVVIGMPTHRDIPPKTVLSLVSTFAECHKRHIPVELSLVISGAVVTGRDMVVDDFLRGAANRLFWIDSDQTWTPKQFIRLLELSKKVEIVGATYPAKLDPPTFYVKHDESKGLQRSGNGLIKVQGFGLGFTVIRREVIEHIAGTKPVIKDTVGGRSMAEIFRWGTLNGDRQGEDMAFFADLQALGHTVWLDPDTDIGHIGVKEYVGTIRDAMH